MLRKQFTNYPNFNYVYICEAVSIRIVDIHVDAGLIVDKFGYEFYFSMGNWERVVLAVFASAH